MQSASFIHRDNRLARAARPVARFMGIEAAGGIVLIAATVVALTWANSPWDASYHDLWATRVNVQTGSFRFDEDLHHVVNDVLMAVFFFVVGLEIKRELVTGELRDRRQIALPAVAALGGMLVPAAIYLAFNVGGPGADGWGIPMATDIAFAVGLMAVLGRRVPAPLRVFVLTLAIADDLGAIIVIAAFYSTSIAFLPLLLAVLVAVVVGGLRRLHVTYPPVFVLAGILMWALVFGSGVHATIAGVAMGLLTPATPLQSDLEAEAVVDVLEHRDDLSTEDVRATAVAIKESVAVSDRLIDLLHPWTSYVIIPLFALANAGISFDQNPLDHGPVLMGVLVGLVVGKTVGITAFAWIVVRLRLADLPRGVRWSQFIAAASLAGIGFTVSLFIAELAFDDGALVDSAKIGILVASVVAGLLGTALFVGAARRRPPTPTAELDPHEVTQEVERPDAYAAVDASRHRGA